VTGGWWVTTRWRSTTGRRYTRPGGAILVLVLVLAPVLADGR
jgi:hypothetical protein